MKKTVITEAIRTSVESMLLSGKVTCEICCDLGVSNSVVSRIRKDLIKNGKGALWHTTNYLDNKGWA